MLSQSLRDFGTQVFKAVTSNAQPQRDATTAQHHRRGGIFVDVANLSRRCRLVERHELIARGENRDTWAAMDGNVCVPQGCQEPYLLRTDERTGTQHGLAGEHILTGAPHVVAW